MGAYQEKKGQYLSDMMVKIGQKLLVLYEMIPLASVGSRLYKPPKIKGYLSFALS